MSEEFTNFKHLQMTRRTMIRAGSIGLLGSGLSESGLLRALESEQKKGKRAKAKSVIYIFLSGGLSQIDTFDMKPEAPAEIRGEFSPIQTCTPGLHICEHLPELAKRSERWAEWGFRDVPRNPARRIHARREQWIPLLSVV